LYAIECDIQLTKDNKLIVYHDLSFKGLKIATSTYSELKSAGKLPNGEELPLFRDFLKKALDGKYTRIWVDVKAIPKNFGGDVRSAKACITAMNIARELKAENFIAGFLIRKTFIMQRAAVASKNEFNLAYQSSKAPSYYESRGYTWASQPYGVFYPNNAEKLEKFHDLGIKVKAYELDHVYNVTWFIKHNVDMFGTNYPKMALGVLDSLKNR
jgi:glycerophosphoryl diester phosphodiesterase